MTYIQKIELLKNKIVSALPARQYVKIEDLQINLLIKKTKMENNYDRAINELILNGRIELCGNAIRLNQ